MNIKLDIVSFIEIMTLMQGVLLGLILIFNSKKKYPNLFLGLFIISYTFGIVSSILDDTGILETHPKLLFLPLNFYFLSLPLLYLYLKKLIIQVPQKNTLFHIIPGVVEFIVFCILSLLPNEIKTNLLQNPKLIHFLLVYLFSSLLFSMFYAFKILIIIRKHQKSVLDYYSDTEKKLLNWIRYVALFIIIYYSVNFIFFYFIINEENIFFYYIYPTLSIVNVVFVYWVGVNGLRQSAVSIAANDLKKETINPDKIEKETKLSGVNESLYPKLIELMENRKPYKNPELTLVMLAEQMNISREFLSKMINRYANVNFNTFVNQYRIEEAKHLLVDDEYEHLNMTGIASEAGFRSKSTFFSVFKKITHITPKNYKSNTIR